MSQMTKSHRWGQSPLQSTFPHWPPLPSSHIPTTLTNQSTPPHTSQVLHNNQAHHQCGRKISHHSPGSLQHHLTGELKRCISGFQRFYLHQVLNVSRFTASNVCRVSLGSRQRSPPGDFQNHFDFRKRTILFVWQVIFRIGVF